MEYFCTSFCAEVLTAASLSTLVHHPESMMDGYGDSRGGNNAAFEESLLRMMMAEMSVAAEYDPGMMYDYESDGACSFDDTPVTFLRPDGDTEGKDVQWCLDNDFFEVEEGLWSGDWYYMRHPEERRFHEQRLKRTRDIRTRAEKRRARVRAGRTGADAMEAWREAAVVSALMGDISRQTGRSPSEVQQMLSERRHSGFSPYGTKKAQDATAASEEKPAEKSRARGDAADEVAAGAVDAQFQIERNGTNALEGQEMEALTSMSMQDISCQSRMQARTSSHEIQQMLLEEDFYGAHRGSPYGTHHGSSYGLNDGLNMTHPKERVKDKRHQKMHQKGSEEYEETRRKRLLEKIVCWADGDQGIVDRTRAAIRDGRGFRCKCPCCRSMFPTKECAQLHARHVSGRAHDRYRRKAGLPKPTGMMLEHGGSSRCACCQLTLRTEQLASFHLKNYPDKRHRDYRMENDMAQEWDLEDVRERYCCPVGCGKWYFSQVKVDAHIKTQSGKSHNRYRMENNID